MPSSKRRLPVKVAESAIAPQFRKLAATTRRVKLPATVPKYNPFNNYKGLNISLMKPFTIGAPAPASAPKSRVRVRTRVRTQAKSVPNNYNNPYASNRPSSTTITKMELLKSLPDKYIALGHGGYQDDKYFVVPKDVLIIFVSQPSRYLPQYIITPDFYKYFERANRNYSNRTVSVPSVLEGRYERMYGPGEQIYDLTLEFKDPNWPGMGLHSLPIEQGIFKNETKPGEYSGKMGRLNELVKKGPGVYFIVSCRALPYQPFYQYVQNQTIQYFPTNTTWLLGSRIQRANKASKSMKKRRMVDPRPRPGPSKRAKTSNSSSRKVRK